MKLILRNDDLCSATSATHLQKFCALADKHGYKLIHAITPRGVCWAKDRWLGNYKNSEIVALGAGITIEQNTELIEFLRSRASTDVFALHGLFHTHRPPVEDWLRARDILLKLGLYPLYLVPPFNEGSFKSHDFFVSGEDAESFETTSAIQTPIAQMHSWRFDPEMWRGKAYQDWWTWENLEEVMQYPVMLPSETNTEKYEFLAPRIKGKWLDIGCNRGALLDMVPDGTGVDASSVPLKPGMYHAKAEDLPFPDNSFDTAVLCSVLEQCPDPKKVMDEALRVVRPGGCVIGTCPYPGTPYGTAGFTQWTCTVIDPAEFPITERINDEHYYFEVQK